MAMKRVETAVVCGDTGQALALARTVPAGARTTSNNRNRHLLDVAFAQVDTRRYTEATQTLTTVLRAAPLWLRHQRLARDIVASLVALRRRAISRELTDLTRITGVDL
ncbi:hypothetical protein [Luedemannella flava]